MNSKEETKLIGQGAYGCIFKPAFMPKGKRNYNTKNKISKLLIKNDDTELEKLKKLNVINSEGKYHPKFNPSENIIETKETIDILKELNKNIKYKHCKLVHDKHKLDKYIINMEYGGVDLSKYLKKKTNDGQNILSKQETINFLKEYLNLINGAILFKTNKLVHFDIKLPNIVYNELAKENEKMKFIDFGIMLDLNITNNELLNLLFSKKKYFEYDYALVYPVEILFLSSNIFILFINYYNAYYENNVDEMNKNKTLIHNYYLTGINKYLYESELGYPFIQNLDFYVKIFNNKYKTDKIKNINKVFIDISNHVLFNLDKYSLINVLFYFKKYLNKEIINNIIKLYYNKLNVFNLPSLNVIYDEINNILLSYNPLKTPVNSAGKTFKKTLQNNKTLSNIKQTINNIKQRVASIKKHANSIKQPTASNKQQPPASNKQPKTSKLLQEFRSLKTKKNTKNTISKII